MDNQDNKVPDEATLTLWMDGNLEGPALDEVELWVKDHPELLSQRHSIQAINEEIKAQIPNSTEPPYPDFFNQQIFRRIEQETPLTEVKEKPTVSLWQRLLLPTALAGMACCFFIGTQIGGQDGSSTPSHTAYIYTPDDSVSADLYTAADNSTIIVLEGLEDIPDELDIASNLTDGMTIASLAY